MGLNVKILVSVLLLSNLLFAYGPLTHKYVAKQVLLNLYPDCAERIEEGAVYPDEILQDFENHHCYHSAASCPALDARYCPPSLDCPSEQKASEWIANAEGQSGCEQAFFLAVATHYYLDAHDPMENIVNVNDSSCKTPFDNGIDARLPSITPAVEICCDILKSTKCRFTSSTLSDLITYAQSNTFRSGFRYNFSNEENTGCFYHAPDCQAGYGCTYNECVPMEGCEWDNPRCGRGYKCLNNSCVPALGCDHDDPVCRSDEECIDNECVKKRGCLYENPPCNDDENCVDNECQLKPGCQYNNPPCDEGYVCENNDCVVGEGCQYNNPACGAGEECVNNSCVEQSNLLGCAYNNPACAENETCMNNTCVPKSGGGCGLPFAIIALLLIAAFSRVS